MTKKTPAFATPADERLRRDEAPHLRGGRDVSEDVARTNETGLVNDNDDLERLLADEFDHVALPTPPSIPGWHVCWLTTNSQYDPISRRQRLGYQPVLQAEVPGFEVGGSGQASFEGVITCSEMVLYKIEESRYQTIMRTHHHKRPLEEEEQIYAQVRAQSDTADSTGRSLAKEEGDGFNQLGQNIKRAKMTDRPVFA